MTYLELACRSLIALVFCVSAISKIRTVGTFSDFNAWLAGMPVVPKRGHTAAAVVFVGGELLIVGCLIIPAANGLGFLLAAVLLVAFSAGIYLAMRQELRQPCLCFGVSTLPLGWPHIARNVGLFCVALVGFLATGSVGARPAGIAISVSAALVLALLFIFFDDLVDLFLETTPL
jgi:hypothetical protein